MGKHEVASATAEQVVIRQIDSQLDEMVEALRTIVRIQSINPKYPGQSYDGLVGREALANGVVAELYEEAGADVESVVVEKGRDNIVGVVGGRGGGRSLALNGHVDVVPGGRVDAWTHGGPFSGHLEEDRVYGRGTVDDKGGIVAHAFAAVALKRAGVRLAGDLVLQSVVGEEMGDHLCGTTAVFERGYVGDSAVVCEPTSRGKGPAMVTVTPGLLWFAVTVIGKQAHSGLRGVTIHPTLDGETLGVNAIDKGMLIYEGLRGLENEWAARRRHPLFEPGSFGILPGVVQGSAAGILVPFSIADEMTLQYCIYHHPGYSNESVKGEVEERLRDVAKLDPWLREHPPIVDWKLEWPPTEVTPEAEIKTQLSVAYSRAAEGTPFAAKVATEGFLGVCDMTWLQAKGVPTVVFGPGNARKAHAADEYVTTEELLLACRTYALLAMGWCGTEKEPAPTTARQ